MTFADLESEIVRQTRRRQMYSGLAVLIVAAVLIAGFDVSNSMNSGSFWTGLGQFFDYPAGLLSEAWETGLIGMAELMWRFLPALIETLNIAVAATLLGGLGASVLSLAATPNLGAPAWLRLPLRRVLDVMRAFPELIIALFLIFVLGTSPVPAMIAVAFHTVGALGKLFSEVNENIDVKPMEGLASSGASWFQRIRYGVIPQVAPNWLSYFLLRLEINVRASAILGFVGAGGIGTELRRTIGWGQGSGDETIALFVLLIVSIFLIDQLSSWGRARLAGRQGQGEETSAQTAHGHENRVARVRAMVRRRTALTVLAPALALGYLAYAWVAFDVTGLIASARPERAAILATDSVMYKTHVEESLRTGEVEVAIEGERTATYAPDALPDWVRVDGETWDVDLGDGWRVTLDGPRMTVEAPGYGTIRVTAQERELLYDLPAGPQPDWLRTDPVKFDMRPEIGKRVQASRAKFEIHRYHWGWENFWFPFRSPLWGMSAGEVWSLAWSPDRLDPAMSNAAFIFDQVWTNPDWMHGEVFKALLETIMMALLGTLVAAFVGLPLAFLAAANFTPSLALRFGVRRLFDLLRGIDMLIWSLIFIRAFGLGPLTGALAIAFTDTGSLGKLFSEALENVDDKQIEGVHSTGASQLQRYRFGVLPQILPVFLSQALYYLESNTRSATVIGALGAGGIGLMLVETMRTSRDWENTLYIIVLTILVVFAMDALSGWLRRRLIQGHEAREV
ncbi:phosphonate ABC transporter, permease protein PhnE [Albimonas pacifica]|uniref:Phosphonate transport system permease protein n=1 Tax=Albimonas pacifica TaxID=1114924 RepID=A0A1I3ECI3_9RHOB|nr:phosphonate transport system permease protein [Albimonas pacifica]